MEPAGHRQFVRELARVEIDVEDGELRSRNRGRQGDRGRRGFGLGVEIEILVQRKLRPRDAAVDRVRTAWRHAAIGRVVHPIAGGRNGEGD